MTMMMMTTTMTMMMMEAWMRYLVRQCEPAKQWKKKSVTIRRVKWSTTYEQLMDQRQWCFHSSFHEDKIRIYIYIYVIN